MSICHRILLLTSFIICNHVQIVAGFLSPIARESIPVERRFLPPRVAKMTSLAIIKKSSLTATMISTTATSEPAIETSQSAKQNEQHNVEDTLTLIPVSSSPIMLTSSRPLLSKEECSIVRRYFEYINNIDSNKIKKDDDGTLKKTQISQEEDIEMGKRLVERLQDQIDELTGCPRHSGELQLPRYITYDPPCRDLHQTANDKVNDGSSNNNNNKNNNYKQNSISNQNNTIITRDQLFPDGLHVDSNNGKFFRHVTILLYLTTNEFGATTFPLATKRRPSSSTINDNNDDSDDHLVSSCKIQNAAEKLIQGKVHHTLMTGEEDEELIKCARTLEDSAVELFERDNNHRQGFSNDADGDDDDNDPQTSSATTTTSNKSLSVQYDSEQKYGIRVVPSAGHICVFCNLEESSGGADPTSFHGGEMLMKSSHPDKAVLTFFKEIPMGTFTNQKEFTERVCETRAYLLDRYFSSFALQ